MKILFVNESLGGGGAERQLGLIANEWSAAGHRVAFATWASREVHDVYPLAPDIERIHFRRREPTGGRGRRALGHLCAFARLLARIARFRPAVLMSFSEASNILTVLAGRLMRTPTVVSIRVDPEEMFRLNPHWRKPAIRAYARATRVVVQTAAAAKWCQQQCGRSAVIIPNILRDLPAALPPAARQPVIVAVGRLDVQKGHDLLIRAFAAVHASHPEWRLAIFGEGPERAALEALAAELGVADIVALRGFATGVEAELNRAQVFALASRFEGFPNALIEAMGLGLACISSDCDFGPREIVTSGEDGLLVPVEDVPALAAGLDRLMSDRALRERLAANALMIRGRYSPARVMALWSDAVHGAAREAR